MYDAVQEFGWVGVAVVFVLSLRQQSEEQYQGERYAAQIIDIGIALSAEMDVEQLVQWEQQQTDACP